jgi:two-component system chemotaxis response regulator CheY
MEKTILIVDDSNLVIKLVSFRLEKDGYHVLTGSDGKEALAYFDGRNIDLVVTDLNMPNMDGLTLIKEIRSTASYQYTPVVLFISPEPEDKKHINTSGATALLVKDEINQKLSSTVKKLIR